MSYLQKIKPSKTGIYNISRSLGCGDRYKNGSTHLISASKEKIQLLHSLMILMRVKVTKITKNPNVDNDFYFKFTAKYKRYQIFLFRMCRYIRTAELYEVLKFSKELIEDYNIKYYNALLLSHMIIGYSKNIIGYSPNMDIFPLRKSLGYFVLFRSEKSFNLTMSQPTINSNQIFNRQNFNTAYLNRLQGLIKNKKYKELENAMIESKEMYDSRLDFDIIRKEYNKILNKKTKLNSGIIRNE